MVVAAGASPDTFHLRVERPFGAGCKDAYLLFSNGGATE